MKLDQLLSIGINTTDYLLSYNMKPYGLYYVTPGCTCSLCRSRGYRKINPYDSITKAGKNKARQLAKTEIRKQIKDLSK